MRFRGLTKDGDWTFGAGKQGFARDSIALRLNLVTRLRSWRDDCFFAPEEGVDYNNLLDIGTKRLLDLDVRRVILQSEGVIRIRDYESTLNRDSRDISVEATLETIFGKLSLKVAV